LKADLRNISRESDNYHFVSSAFSKVHSQTNWRTCMTNDSTITKLWLAVALAILFTSSAIAAQKKQNTLYKRPATYYRAAPVPALYREPFGYSISQGGIYHNDVLPDGTLTGPIAPHANGG
jgi:hypothetical protein